MIHNTGFTKIGRIEGKQEYDIYLHDDCQTSIIVGKNGTFVFSSAEALYFFVNKRGLVIIPEKRNINLSDMLKVLGGIE